LDKVVFILNYEILKEVEDVIKRPKLNIKVCRDEKAKTYQERITIDKTNVESG